jgi:hypothetical protein
MSGKDENWQEELIEEKDFVKYANAIIDYFLGPLEGTNLKLMQEDLVNLLIGLTCTRGVRKEKLATVSYFMDAFRDKKENYLEYGTLCAYMVVIYDIVHKFECDKYKALRWYSKLFKFELGFLINLEWWVCGVFDFDFKVKDKKDLLKFADFLFKH